MSTKSLEKNIQNLIRGNKIKELQTVLSTFEERHMVILVGAISSFEQASACGLLSREEENRERAKIYFSILEGVKLLAPTSSSKANEEKTEIIRNTLNRPQTDDLFINNLEIYLCMRPYIPRVPNDDYQIMKSALFLQEFRDTYQESLDQISLLDASRINFYKLLLNEIKKLGAAIKDLEDILTKSNNEGHVIQQELNFIDKICIEIKSNFAEKQLSYLNQVNLPKLKLHLKNLIKLVNEKVKLAGGFSTN